MTPFPPPCLPCVDSTRPPCVRSKRPRVYRHHAHMLKHMCAWCRHTRGRFECAHGGRFLNVHTVFFHFSSACRNTHKHAQTHTHTHTHQTHTTTTNNTTTTTTHTTQHNTTHNTTRRQRQRDRETEKEDRERETRQDKDKRREKREDEEEREREDEEEQEERRWKGKWKRQWRGIEMKEKVFFPKKCFKTLKPARWIKLHMFSNKNPRRTNYSSIFLRMFRIWLCFQLFTWFEFDFSGREN